MRVLIVEDEAPLRAPLVGGLRQQGYAVDEAEDGPVGRYAGQEYPIDVAVVDLGLPRLSGLAVIEHWRAAGRRFPILILTARGRWQDKVAGLEAGADDYRVKPFELEELLARRRALRRRAEGWTRSVIGGEAVALDIRAQRLTVHGDPVELTSYEYRLLEYLMRHAGQVVSKTELTEHLYEEDWDRDSNVLEVLVGRIRRKLDPAQTLNPIETLRGRGYRFRLPRAPA